MGSSFGFFWANRDYLALNTTDDNTRNYYYGVETFALKYALLIIALIQLVSIPVAKKILRSC